MYHDPGRKKYITKYFTLATIGRYENIFTPITLKSSFAEILRMFFNFLIGIS
jgi:hypothetical protein